MYERPARCRRTTRRTFASRALRRFAREDDAGPIVEFAVIVPVLLILVLGIVDFARAFFQQNNLVAAAREGARYAAVQEFPCLAATHTRVRAQVMSYYSSVGGAAPTNTAANIPVTTTGTCPSGVTSVTVQIVSYPFTPITPLFRLLRRTDQITLSARATYRWERAPEV
ncbi:MAG: TadE/TadG family type IV pilus assembly protein [Gemmatimonadota bacterium]